MYLIKYKRYKNILTLLKHTKKKNQTEERFRINKTRNTTIQIISKKRKNDL